MKDKKVLTEELINERLEALGFGEKQSSNEEEIMESVLNHYNVQFNDNWSEKGIDFYIYEENTADGYSVYVATNDPRRISVCENIHYYSSGIEEALVDAIKYSNGYPEEKFTIYAADIEPEIIEGAMETLFNYLKLRFEVEVTNNLKNEGYESK